MPPKKDKLKKLERIINAFDSEAVTNEDFDNKTRRLLELVKKLVQNNTEALARLEAKFQTMLKQIASNHDISLTDLKTQTNQLFVGERLNEMSEGNTTQFQALQTLLDEKIASTTNGKDGVTPTSDELLALITPLVPKNPDLRDLKKAVIKLAEELKKLKAHKFTKSGGGSRFISGPNAHKSFTTFLNDQCDGENKTFYITTFTKIVSLTGSQFPFVYHEGIDYTLGDKQIIMTNEVAPVEAGQTLRVVFEK